MLYNIHGDRKYLTSAERRVFLRCAEVAQPDIATFCLTLAFTGARISEALALTPSRIDLSAKAIVIETLKKRRRGVFRTVPVPDALLDRLEAVHSITARQCDQGMRDHRLWPWCRTTAWKHVKAVMQTARLNGACSMPKGLRHALAVQGTAEAGIPLNIMQRWLGHSRIETTAIYANAVGAQERMLAEKIWQLR